PMATGQGAHRGSMAATPASASRLALPDETRDESMPVSPCMEPSGKAGWYTIRSGDHSIAAVPSAGEAQAAANSGNPRARFSRQYLEREDGILMNATPCFRARGSPAPHPGPP